MSQLGFGFILGLQMRVRAYANQFLTFPRWDPFFGVHVLLAREMLRTVFMDLILAGEMLKMQNQF